MLVKDYFLNDSQFIFLFLPLLLGGPSSRPDNFYQLFQC